MTAILVAIVVLAADPGELVRRAEVRLAHGNVEGARALLAEAVATDPACGPALALLAETNDGSGVEPKLLYLEWADPLDPERARTFLSDLVGKVAEPDDEARCCVERWAITPASAPTEPCGPWFGCQRPDVVPLPWFAEGPLRAEAFEATGHREALTRIADRFFHRQAARDAKAWAWLAMLLAEVGAQGEAQACIERARPATIEERCACAAAGIALATDPVAAWTREAEPIVDELAKGEAAREAKPLFDAARRALLRQEDLPALLRLAAAEIACASSADKDPSEVTFDAVERRWHADEALRAAQGPALAAVRAELLFDMRQDNLALDELERAAEGGSPQVWGALYRAYGRCGLEAPRIDAGLRLIEAGAADADLVAEVALSLEAAGRDEEAGALWRRGLSGALGEAAARRLLDEWAGMEPRPAIREVAVDAVGLATVPSKAWIVAAVDDAIDAGAAHVALVLLDRLAEDESEETLTPPDLRGATSVMRRTWLRSPAAGLAFLRECASADRLSNAQDAVLRLVCGRSDFLEVRGLVVRIRWELLADEAFLAKPGAGYVLSLLFDAHLQPAEGRWWRRVSRDAGFRSRGLFLDLAADGEEVLDELAELDPVAARLEGALRAGGTEALARLIEEDAAWPYQLSRAREELERRRREWPPRPPKEEEQPAGTARRIWGLLWTDPCQARWDWIDWRDDLLVPRPPKTAADLVRELRDGAYIDSGWGDEAVGVVRREGDEALRALLACPAGAEVACGLHSEVDAIRLLPAVQEESRRHPTDLRWAEPEAWILGRGQGAADAEARAASGQTRNEALLLGTLRTHEDLDDLHALLPRLEEVGRAETVRSLLGRVNGAFLRGPGEATGREFLLALLPRCRDDGERDLVAWTARFWKLADVRERIDKELLTSTDVAARFDAIARGRSVSKPAPDDVAALARDPRWDGPQASVLWAWTVVDAIATGRGDLVEEGLEAIWSLGLRGAPVLANARGGCQDVVSELLGAEGLSEAILARIDAGSSSPALLWFLAQAQCRRPSAAAGPALERAWEGGIVGYGELWRRRALATERGRTIREVETVLQTYRDPRECLDLHGTVYDLARELRKAGRVEEAAACVDAWARRCGPLSAEERGCDMSEIHNSEYVYYPFSLWECFRRCVAPPGALAAQSLDGIGLLDAAWERLTDELRGSWPEEVRLELRRARAGVALDAVGSELENAAALAPERGVAWLPEAVADLCEVARAAPSADLRRDAWLRVLELWEGHPPVRRWFIEAYLAERASLPPAPAAEVSAWEARLGQADAPAREEADDALRRMGQAAVPVLRVLWASSDAEVRQRVELILEELAHP